MIRGTIREDPNLAGDATADRIDGRAGADTIAGGEGADTISRGGDGNDVLRGFGPADAHAGSRDILAWRGVDTPVFVTSASGNADRLFVVENTGKIQILDRRTCTAPAEFLRLPGAGRIPLCINRRRKR